jgi:hypothetical protein
MEEFMKSVEQLLAEAFDQLIKAGKKDVVLTMTTEQKGKPAEQRLSEAVAKCKEFGITESASRPARITRNNGDGRGVGISATTTLSEQDRKILHHMDRTGCSFRESSIVMTGKDPGRDATFPAALIESLKAEWRAYARGMINEADIETLAKRGVRP